MFAQATTPALLSAVLLAVLGLSVWFDVTERRIPNNVTLAGVASALILRTFMGPGALVAGFTGGAAGLALGVVLFAAGAMGAGDGKLLAAVGALLGLGTFLWCLPLIGAFGGLLALAESLRLGTLVPTLLRFRALLFHVVSFGRIGEARTLSAAGAITVPYGVAIAAGAVTAWLSRGMPS